MSFFAYLQQILSLRHRHAMYALQSKKQWEAHLSSLAAQFLLGSGSWLILLILSFTTLSTYLEFVFSGHASPYLAFVYTPVMVLCLGFLVLRPRKVSGAVWYVEVIVLAHSCAVVGLVWVTQGQGVHFSGQISLSLVGACLFSYLKHFGWILARNLLWTIFYILPVWCVQDWLVNFHLEIVQGFILGTLGNYTIYRMRLMRFYDEEVDADEKKFLYHEMSKQLYPHQVEMIRSGAILEQTMPLGEGSAYVISGDVISSDSYEKESLKNMMVDIYSDFYHICMSGYSYHPLTSRAFRLKETGDGYIASVGFPCRSVDPQSAANQAVEVALEFLEVFKRTSKIHLGYRAYSAAGIGFGRVFGTFHLEGIKAYDLYGEALVLSARYESARKTMGIESFIR